jgi:tubulin beta
MREIVHVQVGNCGNQLGSAFWDALSAEHEIFPGDSSGGDSSDAAARRQRAAVYFNETAAGRNIPRAVCIDLDSSSIDAIRSGPLRSLFTPSNFVTPPEPDHQQQRGTFGIYARGRYGEGALLLDAAAEAVRQAAEAADALQGLQYCHGLGGGTGSGLGSLILSRLRDEYPASFITTFSVLPSPSVSSALVEAYNAALSLPDLARHADATLLLRNGSLYAACAPALAQAGLSTVFPHRPGDDVDGGLASASAYGMFNRCAVATALLPVAQQLSSPPSHRGVSSLLDLRALTHALVPDTRLNFIAPDPQRGGWGAYDPASSSSGPSSPPLSSSAAAAADGGSAAVAEVVTAASLLGHSPAAVHAALASASEQFDHLYRRKTFLSCYMSESMCESEFVEAQSLLHDLATTYAVAAAE